MLQVVPHWLRLLAWPARLHGDYSPAFINQATAWGALQTFGAALLVGLAVLGWLSRRAAPAILFGVLWCGVALFPVSNVLLPTGVVLSERSLYLPSVGFLLVVGALCAWGVTRARPRMTRAITLAAGVMVIAGVARSAVRHRDWKDLFTFWDATARDTPLSYKGHYAYGVLLRDRGDHAGAIRSLSRAIVLYPRAFWAQNEMGDLYQKVGDCESALRHYAASLEIQRNQFKIRVARMACLVQLGRIQEAQAEADEAERLQGTATLP
jgi:tetratricopeptide (TPR) repeat protein